MSPLRLASVHRAVHSTVSVKHIILKSRDWEMHILPKREYHTLDLIIVYKLVVNKTEAQLKI